MKKKVIIIGGGSSGLMAACASSKKYDVTILEKQKKLGTKLLISGGGRCNLTNINSIEHIISCVVGNGKFLYSALNQFSNLDIIGFFESRGLKLKEEDNGRMFPVTDKSRDVLRVLENELDDNNVKIRYGVEINDVKLDNGKIQYVIDQNNTKWVADHFIFALGGKSYFEVGTTGDGYKLLKKIGHTITDLYPVEVPLVSNDGFIQDKSLMGLSFKNVATSVLKKNGKPLVTHKQDIIFTHFGMSGPGALRCSSFVQKELKKQDKVTVSVDFLPELSNDELTGQIVEKFTEHSDKLALNVIGLIVNKKVGQVIFEKLEINEQAKAKQIRRNINDIVKYIKNFEVQVQNTQGFSKAFVTGGGVKIKEIDPKTLKSKVCENLSICGEIIDINAYTGGYNITAAFTTGYNAGNHI